jgi:hypothetical protein
MKTNKELGEIGARAAQGVQSESEIIIDPASRYWTAYQPEREAFAAAVAEEVRKEYPADWSKDSSLETWFPITAQELTDLRSQLESAVQQIKDARVNLAACEQELEEKTARLAQLEWRPTSVKPTREDADRDGNIETVTPDGRVLIRRHDTWPWPINSTTAHKVTHWRAVPPPPAPTAEEAERAKFETWAKSQAYNLHRQPSGVYTSDCTASAWVAWQAASASKEVQP